VSADPAPAGTRVLVIGVGNPLMSDDGVGQRLLEALAARATPNDGVEFLDAGTLGFMLLPHVEQCDALLALDAASVGGAPGEHRIFEGAEFDEFVRQPRCSVHELGLHDLIDAARLTGALPARRALVGVQPECLGWGMSLSPPVEAALPAAVEAAAGLLERWLAASRC
jgi:hydrogenase maturation protease